MGETKKKDDLFNSTMSLGDHLEELRMRLLYALGGLALASIICFCFGPKIIAFMEKPYINAMGKEARLITLAPADG
ncbi:MAG: twin-arginine translocase subunit TatC, partial [Planctomycetota bacterium]